DQGARLGREQHRAVHRREADEIEPALLALGDEQPVDREQRREQERRDQHPSGEVALEAGAVEAEPEDDEGGDREQGHRRERAERAELDPQVLAQKGAVGGHRSSSTTSAPAVANSRSWLTTARVRSPAAISGSTARRASASRWASGSSRRSSSGVGSTARQMSIR